MAPHSGVSEPSLGCEDATPITSRIRPNTSDDGSRDLAATARSSRLRDVTRVSLAIMVCLVVFSCDLVAPDATMVTQLYPAAFLLLYGVRTRFAIAGVWLFSMILIGAGSWFLMVDQAGTSLSGRTLSILIVSMTAVALAKFSTHESKLWRQALVDPLTGVFNRRSFLEFALREEARTQRGGNNFAVLMIDIDHFKRVNDVHGHAAGDAVIKELADVATRTLRPSDVLARYGGEEFVVSLPDTTPDQARTVAERLREAVETTAVVSDTGAIRFTISIGIATCSHATPLNDAIARADTALYAAKRNGRNRVEMSLPVGLPGAAAQTVPTDVSEPQGAPSNTVLVVDDEDDIRELLADWLRQNGYTVRTAENADAALAVIETDDSIALLVTDIVMPGELNGFDLGQKAQSLRPDLKLLYMSGYDASAPARAARGDAAQVLQKPFRMNNMLESVVSALSA